MIEKILNNARLTSSGRKLLTSEQKVYIVQTWESSSMSCPEFCRRYGLISGQLYHWRKNAKRGAIMSIKNQGDLHSKAEMDALKRENDELKKALGEATLDMKILKKKLEMDQQREKKLKR